MGKVKAIIIIEMMGRPKEHLKAVMIDFLKKLEIEKGTKVLSKTIHEPKEIEEKDKDGEKIKFVKGKELFTNFAEIELEFNEFMDLIRIVFVYMPSHVEIIEPDKFEVPHGEMTLILNEITNKLHQYDAIAKNALMQNQILSNKVQILEQYVRSRGAQIQPLVANVTTSVAGKETEKKIKKSATKKKKKK
jgi:hypothetical protein